MTTFFRQKDSEPSLVSRKRLSRREFALQTSPRLGIASHVLSQSFLPLPKQKGRRLAQSLRQKDSEPSLASRKRLSQREFALQTSPRLGFASHVISQSFLPLPRKKPSAFANGFFLGRGRRTRTHDPWFWRPVLYQLSYTPVCISATLNIIS